MTLVPPQAPPEWNHSAEDIIRLTKNATEEYRKQTDTVGSLDPKDCTFDSVFLKLEIAKAEWDLVIDPLTFYRKVSPQKELRDASNEACSLLEDFDVDTSKRLDVYNAKCAAESNIKASGQWEKLSPEDQLLVEKLIRDSKRDGLDLPEEKRTELTALEKELDQVCLEFDKNYDGESGVITFTAEELEGVPSDVVSGYTKRTTQDGNEVYDATYKDPDIYPLFKSTNIDTRKNAWESYESRLAVNVPLFDRALELRRKMADLLGYKTWADYQTEIKMIKTGQGIQEFLDDLEQKLRPVGLKEKDILLAMKKKEHEERGMPFDGELYMWDYGYFRGQHRGEKLSVGGKWQEYFPVSTVVPTILSIYQNLLGVKFEALQEASTWHPDVQAFAVWEKDASDESDFLGYCYLDLFSRSCKYPHAAVWRICPSYEKSDGSRSYPVAVMVTNLAKPTPEKPALMDHGDVVDLFHETGHIFHNLLSRTKFSCFQGTTVAGDFVEAPSQMLENWCWEPKVLELISSHYKTQQPLSADMIDEIIKIRHEGVGLSYLQQLFLAKFDLKVHTDKESEDYTKLWNTLREEVTLFKFVKECPSQGHFRHIMEGCYDAGYYGYMYSLVFAADMYTIFKKDPLNPELGKQYRDKILRVGSSRPELESLKDFLGRELNSDAFLEQLFGASSGH